MTDRAPEHSRIGEEPADTLGGRLRELWARAGQNRGRSLFWIAYAVAAVVTGAGVWLVAAAPGVDSGQGGAQAAASRAVLLILLANLVLIVFLALVVGLRVLDLLRERVSDAGARLHLRFVTLFSLVSVVPAILIAIAFGVLVNRGVDQWFSDNVQSAVRNGADIGRAYVLDVQTDMERDLATISNELGGEVREVFPNRIQFSGALTQIAGFFGYPAIYILNGEGEVLARGETPGAPPYLGPPSSALRTAAAGEEAAVEATQNPDAIRILYPLPDYGDAYLYMVRPLVPGLIGKMNTSIESIEAYREAEESRARIQAAFALSYVETALLVLVGAVWLGLAAANAISRPVARLVQAADRVAEGDLSARVDSTGDPEEIAVLGRAFNRMTGDLQAQQSALKAASEEAQARSLFIETVLSGVSAGVIGLDRKGRISAINDSALQLLAIDEPKVLGKALAKVAPELGDLVARGEARVDEEIDVTRESETLRLRVRVEGGLGGEMVLTFDDITRLVTAQRNAAWKDVARRIAHEIKNPLTPIQLSAERLRRKYRSQVADDVDTFDRCTETIIRQVGDIGRMVDEFSSFARMPAPRFAPEDAAELLREAVFARRVADPEIVFDLIEPTPDAIVHCDGRMVAQALTNLLKNAGEAVLAARAQGRKAAGGVSAALEIEDGKATFIIEDDGVGLPEKDRDRLIEPYVTTREKGTGLGLAIVKRICEDHGGDLKLADAQRLKGARFCMIIPLQISNSSGAGQPAPER
ncbi:MAG: two-component system nitrogen regulation sensor histidine kinase NtrY [Brevundimonas sp.]|jgi:two-component system nitrogen regulation sensor histidine kinase NtrY|uniref:sensor histidine kinase NtrY-like n=1 Tax=Brevundimonas sp. TaxID=1871086 RepID=UPI0039E64C0D